MDKVEFFDEESKEYIEPRFLKLLIVKLLTVVFYILLLLSYDYYTLIKHFSVFNIG